MRRALLAATLLAFVSVATPRHAAAQVSIDIGKPGLSLHAGPPVVVAPPGVVYAPRVYYHGHPRHHHHWKHWKHWKHWDKHRWHHGHHHDWD